MLVYFHYNLEVKDIIIVIDKEMKIQAEKGWASDNSSFVSKFRTSRLYSIHAYLSSSLTTLSKTDKAFKVLSTYS